MNQDGSLEQSDGNIEEEDDDDAYYKEEEEKDYEVGKKRHKADSDEEEPESRYGLRTGRKRQKLGNDENYQA